MQVTLQPTTDVTGYLVWDDGSCTPLTRIDFQQASARLSATVPTDLPDETAEPFTVFLLIPTDAGTLLQEWLLMVGGIDGTTLTARCFPAPLRHELHPAGEPVTIEME